MACVNEMGFKTVCRSLGALVNDYIVLSCANIWSSFLIQYCVTTKIYSHK